MSSQSLAWAHLRKRQLLRPGPRRRRAMCEGATQSLIDRTASSASAKSGNSIMSITSKPLIVAPLAAAVLLGGCATYPPTPASYSYFAVPCDTPGAIRAVPVPPPNTSSVAPITPPQATAPSLEGGAASPDSAAQAAGSECLIAVADRGRGWRGPGYYGGYPRGYYGAPFYGSLGIGIGIGTRHYGGGHRGGGHIGGGHGGGGHRGRGHH